MSYAPSSSSENRVGYGRSNWRDAWLAHAAGFVLSRYYMHLNLWHLRKSKDRVVFKVCLHHATTFDRDFALECSRKAKCDCSFHLGGNKVGVHCDAAIDGADDAMHADCASWLDRDLRNLGDITAERMIDGNAAIPALGRRVIRPAFRPRLTGAALSRGLCPEVCGGT